MAVFNGKKLYDKDETDKSEASVIWGTPPEIFEPLNKEFGFTVDVCAIEENAKCEKYFTPEMDGLRQSWANEVCWCNPPYGTSVVKWCKKALAETENGTTTILLIPCRTNTNWWHDFVMPFAEIRFLRGRVRFIQNGIQFTQAFPFPLSYVIYRAGKSFNKKDYKEESLFGDEK